MPPEVLTARGLYEVLLVRLSVLSAYSRVWHGVGPPRWVGCLPGKCTWHIMPSSWPWAADLLRESPFPYMERRGPTLLHTPTLLSFLFYPSQHWGWWVDATGRIIFSWRTEISE